MLSVTGLFIYPIKSLRGISLQEAVVTSRGFQYDRQWMLVDENNRFLSQREFAVMALLEPEIIGDMMIIHNRQREQPPLSLALHPVVGETIMVNVWSDRCRAAVSGKEADEWFSSALGMNCRLVYMPESTNRRVDGRYAHAKENTMFSDGYPFMMIGESSLEDLNSRLEIPLPMNRFRPNIVFAGGQPYQEDEMKSFRINNMNFAGVKLCARCNVTTIDQETTLTGKEPLKTFASYRRKNNKVYFGQNLLCDATGKISLGDELMINDRSMAGPAPETSSS